MDISALRKLFPVTEHALYLNSAAESPLHIRGRERLDEYLTLALEAPHKKPSSRRACRTALSALLGGAADDYALVTSTGIGTGMAAAGIDWRPGDNVVLPAEEHANNTFPWLALREQGVEVRLVPVDPDQRIDPQKVADRVDSRTRVLAAAAVRYNTGFRADLKTLSSIAHRSGALFLVDGIQAAGVTPLNIEEDGIDLLAAAGFKWLLGMHGTGFFYANARAQEIIRPVIPGMFAAEDDIYTLHYLPGARRYETGAIAYGLFHAWTAGLELVREIGVEQIYARVLALTGRLVDGLRARGITVVTPVDCLNERSAIVAFTLGSEQANNALYEQLLAQDMVVAPRDGRIRVSPNFFNTEDEIDRFLAALP